MRVTVPVTRLDDEFPNETIDVLKVDTEGADTWVLLGCDRLLKDRRVKKIFFEQNATCMERLGIRPGEVQNFLRDHGYDCEPFKGRGGRGDGEWIAEPAA